VSFQVDLELPRNASRGFDAGGVPSFLIHVAHFRPSFYACLPRPLTREVSLHRNLGQFFDRFSESFLLGLADRLKLDRGPILDNRLSTLVALEAVYVASNHFCLDLELLRRADGESQGVRRSRFQNTGDFEQGPFHGEIDNGSGRDRVDLPFLRFTRYTSRLRYIYIAV